MAIAHMSNYARQRIRQQMDSYIKYALVAELVENFEPVAITPEQLECIIATPAYKDLRAYIKKHRSAKVKLDSVVPHTKATGEVVRLLARDDAQHRQMAGAGEAPISLERAKYTFFLTPTDESPLWVIGMYHAYSGGFQLNGALLPDSLQPLVETVPEVFPQALALKAVEGEISDIQYLLQRVFDNCATAGQLCTFWPDITEFIRAQFPGKTINKSKNISTLEGLISKREAQRIGELVSRGLMLSAANVLKRATPFAPTNSYNCSAMFHEAISRRWPAPPPGKVFIMPG